MGNFESAVLFVTLIYIWFIQHGFSVKFHLSISLSYCQIQLVSPLCVCVCVSLLVWMEQTYVLRLWRGQMPASFTVKQWPGEIFWCISLFYLVCSHMLSVFTYLWPLLIMIKQKMSFFSVTTCGRSWRRCAIAMTTMSSTETSRYFWHLISSVYYKLKKLWLQNDCGFKREVYFMHLMNF